MMRPLTNKLANKRRDADRHRPYDGSVAYLLVVAPTERELAGLRPDQLDGFRVAEIGLGHRAADNLREILEARRPQMLLSIGLGGALSDELRTGDVVVCTEAATEQFPTQRLSMDAALIDQSMGALVAAGVRVSRGNTLTVQEPLMSSEDKQRQGALTGTTFVDMETYWIAQEAERAGVPLVSVRVVIDEMGYNLPGIVADIIADGGQREWFHALRALRNPANVGALVPLAVRSRKAIAALREVVDALVPLLAKDAPVRVAQR